MIIAIRTMYDETERMPEGIFRFYYDYDFLLWLYPPHSVAYIHWTINVIVPRHYGVESHKDIRWAIDTLETYGQQLPIIEQEKSRRIFHDLRTEGCGLNPIEFGHVEIRRPDPWTLAASRYAGPIDLPTIHIVPFHA